MIEAEKERDNEITQVPLADFPGIRVGQTQDEAGGTGITVVLCEDPAGMAAGLHIGGGGPACRETGLLDPVTTAQRIHAAVLGGGSAFGLDAAGGVMRYLEEKGIGVEVREIHVPLVAQVDIFDLPVGDPRVRPDQAMGYAACRMSEKAGGNYRDGCYGAGCGATIGKYAGGEHAMKSGIGCCVLHQGNLLVGAIVAVNAFGDIYDWKTGQKIAGARSGDGRLLDRVEMVTCLRQMEENKARASAGYSTQTATNTTIGIVFTNAPFQKPQLCKIAAMAHDGFARSIAPVHTSGDGDSIIALSVPAQSSGNGSGHSVDPGNGSGPEANGGDDLGHAADIGNDSGHTAYAGNKNCHSASGGEPVIAGIDTVGTLAAWAASEAILQGVRSAESMYGYRALKDLPL